MLSNVKYCKECEECYKSKSFPTCLFCDDICEACDDCTCPYDVDFEYKDYMAHYVCECCICDSKYRDDEKLKQFEKNSKYTYDEVIEKLKKEKNERYGQKPMTKKLQQEIDEHKWDIERLQKELNGITIKLKSIN